MAWHYVPCVLESVSRLSRSQHSIYAGRATICARVTQEIEQAMGKGWKAISNHK